MSADISFWSLFWEAGWVVQFMMTTLFVMSVASWALIFQRARVMRTAQAAARQFEERFWSGVDLSTLYQEVAARREVVQGMEMVFLSGFKEFARLRQQGSRNAETVLDGTQRAMRVSLSREVDDLEHNLPFLATVGSVSPYIGLFGTVWGIMLAFVGLGVEDQATLQTVAAPMAEALVATAMGLFAAIPAVVAFNRFNTQVEKLESAYANFMEEFSTILHRQASATAPAAATGNL